MVAIMALGAFSVGAAAHFPKPPNSAHGELTYHDERDGEDTRDLECQFWVKGTNVTHADGTILVAHDHPDEEARFGSGPPHEHTVGEWEGEPNGSGGYEFVAGPFQLHETADYMAIEAVMNDSEFHRTGGHSGFDYQACENPDEHEPPPPPKCATNVDAEARDDGDVEVTWNASERAETYRIFRTGGQAGPNETGEIAAETLAEVEGTSYVDNETEEATEYRYYVIAQDGPRDAQCDSASDSATTPREGPPEAPDCPQGLEAEARANGDVRLNWQGVIDAETYNVYRATGDGDVEHLAETGISEHLDTQTEPGTTYRYQVTAVNEHGESQDCDEIEVTAIPFFDSPALVAMAAVGSVGAVAAVRTCRG